MSEETELTEEKKQALEKEKAEAWILGQRFAKKKHVPEAHARYWKEQEIEEEEERKLEEEEENEK